MSEIKRTFLECVLVAGVGSAIGLIANAANPDGLSLSRRFFRPTASRPASQVSSRPTDPDPVRQRLIDIGLQPISHEKVVAMFRDPSYRDEIHIFIDARDDDHYAEGHIPGAVQLDQYHIERYIDDVLFYCEAAEKIVVYCGGGECEDSEYAAIILRDEHFVPAEKLYVYTGGITEWTDKGMVIELGRRNSGELEEGTNE